MKEENFGVQVKEVPAFGTKVEHFQNSKKRSKIRTLEDMSQATSGMEIDADTFVMIGNQILDLKERCEYLEERLADKDWATRVRLGE